MALIDTIRAQYPHPVENKPNIGWSKEHYCIGGGLCLATADARGDTSPVRFPAEEYLGSVLLEVNPLLGKSLAAWYARRIVYHNDHGDFDWGWSLLGSALAHTKEED
jgi:hypothetical protein